MLNVKKDCIMILLERNIKVFDTFQSSKSINMQCRLHLHFYFQQEIVQRKLRNTGKISVTCENTFQLIIWIRVYISLNMLKRAIKSKHGIFET